MRAIENDQLWKPPSPVPLARKISARSTGSGRAQIVFNGFVLSFESLLEHKVACILLARPDIVSLTCQAPPIFYRDVKGNIREHYFDQKVALTDGRIALVAVKPAALVARRNFREELSRISAQVRPSDGHVVWLFTDRQAPQWKADNAVDILAALEDAAVDPNRAAEQDAQLIASDLCGTMRIADLLDAGVEMPTILRAFKRNDLSLETPGRLSRESIVRRTAESG